jgi:hypothetical protein
MFFGSAKSCARLSRLMPVLISGSMLFIGSGV